MRGSKQFEILGGSQIGEKAEMLREHLDLIDDVGLKCPPSTVIAHEAFESPEAGEGNPDKQLTKFAKRVRDKYTEYPALAVRSSGDGDGKGNGIYESAFTPGDESSMITAIHTVIQGFDKPHAIEFRRQAGLGDTRAILIQPVVGQVLETEGSLSLFGPALSGYGFSSTPSLKEGWINIVTGLGGGVSRKGGERVSRSGLATIDGRAIDIVRNQSRILSGAIIEDGDPLSLEELVTVRARQEVLEGTFGSSDFRETGRMSPQNSVYGDVLEIGDAEDFRELGLSMRRDNHVYEDSRGYQLELTPIGNAMQNFRPLDLLEKLAEMEQVAEYPLYVEWVITSGDSEITPWIVQIAPLELLSHTEVDRVDLERKYYSGYEVSGMGVKKSNAIVECNSPRDIKHLRAYNANPENAGYILVYPSRLNTSMATRGDNVTYKDCDRASVILEFPDANHQSGSAIEHLVGAANLTGKLFGVIDRHASGLDEIEHEHGKWRDSTLSDDPREGLLISKGDFTTVADELSDRIYVGVVGEEVRE